MKTGWKTGRSEKRRKRKGESGMMEKWKIGMLRR
jgi:hypothetical protein